MNDEQLQFSDKVTHLGHTLSYNLCNRKDIVKATKEPNRKANYILSTFKCAYPSIKSFLLKSFCLSFYDSVFWLASSPDIKIIETAMNHHLCRIWKLPRNSHMAVCHCLGQVSSTGNILFKRFQSIYSSALSSSSPLVVSIFNDSCSLSYTFTGYNYMYGHDHLRSYSDHNTTASLIRFICHHFGVMSHIESLILCMSCQHCDFPSEELASLTVQEPVSPRLAKGYSPEGNWPALFYLSLSLFNSYCLSAAPTVVCINNNNNNNNNK